MLQAVHYLLELHRHNLCEILYRPAMPPAVNVCCLHCLAGFTEVSVVRDVHISKQLQPLSGWAARQEKFNKLLSAATQQDPFFAVLAYKQ